MSWEYLNIIYWPTIRANNLTSYTHSHTHADTHTRTHSLTVCFIMQIWGKLFGKFGNCQCFFKTFFVQLESLEEATHTHTLQDLHTHTWVGVPANSYLYNLIVSCTMPNLRACRHTNFAVCVCGSVWVCVLFGSTLWFNGLNLLKSTSSRETFIAFLSLKSKFRVDFSIFYGGWQERETNITQ